MSICIPCTLYCYGLVKGVIEDIYVSGLPVQGFRVMGLGLGVLGSEV